MAVDSSGIGTVGLTRLVFRCISPPGNTLITGIRADQSANRGQMELVEWDEQHKVVKYNPLLNWSEQEVLKFVEENKVPANTLHKKGFPSIGCAPCTRAIAEGEDPRAGRWWWEATSKECGLHETKEEVKVK